MKVADLGKALQLRYLVLDDNGKAQAVFADERKANTYVMQYRISRKKVGLQTGANA